MTKRFSVIETTKVHADSSGGPDSHDMWYFRNIFLSILLVLQNANCTFLLRIGANKKSPLIYEYLFYIFR